VKDGQLGRGLTFLSHGLSAADFLHLFGGEQPGRSLRDGTDFECRNQGGKSKHQDQSSERFH